MMHDEQFTQKPVDLPLIRRLIGYTRPYRKLIVVLALLMLLSTFLELLRPYVLKIAIDDHINGLYKPMAVVAVDDPRDGFLFEGEKYLRLPVQETGDAQIAKTPEGYVLRRLGAADRVLNEEELRIFRAQDPIRLFQLGGVFLVAILIKFLSDYLQVLWLNRTSQSIILEIRQSTFSHILGRSLRFFDKQATGRLVTRVTNDTENLNEMYTSVLLNLIRDVLLLIGIILVMLRMDLRLALMSLSITPVILLMSVFFRKKIRDNFRRSRSKLSAINANLSENISGMSVTQAFGKEEKVFGKFHTMNRDYLDIAREEVFLFSVFRPSVEMIRSLGIALLLWFGGAHVMGGLLEFGVLYAFIDYLQRFFEPILDLTEQYNILQSAMASSERIFQVLDTDEAIPAPARPKPFNARRGRIVFDKVWFAYDDENWVLQDISFVIEPGQTVAFVGATGAGKTSIINLMARYYDIQKGRITIDGVDIRDMDLNALRKEIGVVLQDVFMFSGTIRDNILVGKPDASCEEMIEVSRYVNADPFIRRLPHGYDEKVMERGVTLSSGERQLLAFARTLLADPAILVLDEATASIDTNTELYIQDALQKISRDRTTIAIAHRLSTIQSADRIFVLAKGHLVEQGTHDELLRENGLYSILHRLQAQTQAS